MAELGDTHELSDAKKLLVASKRTEDKVGVGVAQARALKFAQRHGTDLKLVSEMIGLGAPEQKKPEK